MCSRLRCSRSSSVKDHLALAQVNKECRDVVYKIPPFDFMRM